MIKSRSLEIRKCSSGKNFWEEKFYRKQYSLYANAIIQRQSSEFMIICLVAKLTLQLMQSFLVKKYNYK